MRDLGFVAYEFNAPHIANKDSGAHGWVERAIDMVLVTSQYPRCTMEISVNIMKRDRFNDNCNFYLSPNYVLFC